MPTQKLRENIIVAAIEGFKSQKSRIDQQINDLKVLLSGNSSQPALSEPAPRKRRKMSAAAHRRIALAQKARWAKLRGESEPGPAKVKAPTRKRRISPEGLQRIIAATKKRWRLQKAAAKAKKHAPARRSATAKKAAA